MRALGLMAVVFAACGEPRAAKLEHDAYVWQRNWSSPVVDAVAGAGTELGGLRVLALEIEEDDGAVWPEVDAQALARSGRPVTAVVRIDGARPILGLSIEQVVRKAERWRDAGVEVVGIEIDLDCATAALPEYAAWLRSARPPAGLRWSITALPSWLESDEVADVIAAVDEIVVQVHAIRAPVLFDAKQARAWIDGFARKAHGHGLRVALPTYAVEIGRAEPAEVAAFVRGLERDPVDGLDGVVWFRLPVAGDPSAWSAATLRAVIRGDVLAPDIHARIEDGDIVVENTGTLDAPWPQLRVHGADAWDLLPARRNVRPGEHVVAGWATGEGATVDAD